MFNKKLPICNQSFPLSLNKPSGLLGAQPYKMQFSLFCYLEPLLGLQMNGEVVEASSSRWDLKRQRNRGLSKNGTWRSGDRWEERYHRSAWFSAAFPPGTSQLPVLPPQPGTSENLVYSACHSWHCTTSLSWERPEYKPSSAWWHWLWPWSNDFRSLNLRFLVRFNGKEKNMQCLFLVDIDTFSDIIAWLICKPHNDPLVPIFSETLKSDRPRCKSQLLIY